jgi:dynein heavy chain 1
MLLIAACDQVAELELALRGCQEAVKIPEVSLKEHLVPDVARLAADLAMQADLEGKETAKENFLSKLKGSEELKNAMCNSVLSWHRELSDMSSRFDKQLMSDDTSPMHEREFWLRMERVLSSVEEQSKLPEVDLTLEMVKRLKVRGHIPKQFEEDVGVMRTRLESTRKYCILVKDFPVSDVEAAQDMVSLGASIVQVFEHVRKHLVRSRYPVGRAAKLLEAVSSQVKDKLDQVLRGKQLMDMRYDDFSRLAGFDSSKAVMSAEGSGDGAHVETCQQLFLVWETKEKEFMTETSRLRRYNKDVSDSGRLDAVHRDLAQRVEELAEFRRQHESLRRVVTKVSRAAQSTGAKVSGLAILNQAYQRFKSVDVLDVSAGQDSWGRAMSEYRSMADTVEADMATRLRDSLASSRSSNDMFQIFSVFSALLVRPKIKSAVHEYQNKLIVQVKEDVRMLQDKFKRKYAGSEAERVARVRNIPPVAGSIIWARQVERQLQLYMRRMESVIGEGWEEHVEGQKLQQECEAFGSKLDASMRFRRWQDDVLQQNR